MQIVYPGTKDRPEPIILDIILDIFTTLIHSIFDFLLLLFTTIAIPRSVQREEEHVRSEHRDAIPGY